MTQTATMIEAYPADLGRIDREALAECIDACFSCAQACTACADACLSEDDTQLLMMRRCVRNNLDCADICATTGRMLSRHTGYDANLTMAMLQACRQACKSCGDECARHENPHCRACTAECRRCEQACADLMASMG